MQLPLRRALSLAALSFAAFSTAGAAQAEPPKVLVSIKPVHGLVAAVMQGVATPALLVKGAASPHTYQFRPSDARALEQAGLIIWVGESFESFLEKPLDALSSKARIVEVAELPGVSTLPAREGGVWAPHDHGDAGHEDHDHKHDAHDHDAHDHDAHDHEEADGHLWLSPANAKAMARGFADVLTQMDAANAARYSANAEALIQRIDATDADLAAKLKPVADQPFIVFHDAYQYLEQAYGLTAAGSITVSPDRQPGAQRIKDLRKVLADRKVACVFSEPQFEPRLVKTIVEGAKGVGAGVLDPLGADIAEGPDAWFTMMQRNGDALVGCLKR